MLDTLLNITLLFDLPNSLHYNIWQTRCYLRQQWDLALGYDSRIRNLFLEYLQTVDLFHQVQRFVSGMAQHQNHWKKNMELNSIIKWTLREKYRNTEFFLVRIWTEYGKIRTGKNSVRGHFLHCGNLF